MAGGLFRLGVLVLFLASAGCASFHGSPARSPDAEQAIGQLDPSYAAALKEIYSEGRDPLLVRNRFIETRLAVIDAQYLIFKEHLYREGVSANLLVDTTTLGLNLAGTLTPAASTKGILHAIAGGLTGTRAAAEKNLYFEKTMPALLAQMEALRKTVRLEILKRMQLKAAGYPLSQAEYDLQQYYVAGTIPGAIVGITLDAVGAEKGAALALEEEIRDRLVKQGVDVGKAGQDDERRILNRFIRKPGGRLDMKKVETVESWMVSNGISVSIKTLIDDERYAPERKELVENLRQGGWLD